MKTYEYKRISATSEALHSGEYESRLNELGDLGWELVSSFQLQQLGSTKYSLVGLHSSVISILKREKA